MAFRIFFVYLVVANMCAAIGVAQDCYVFTGEMDGCDNTELAGIFGDESECGDGSCFYRPLTGYYCDTSYVKYFDAQWDGYTTEFDLFSDGYRAELVMQVVCFESGTCECTDDSEPVCGSTPGTISMQDSESVASVNINDVCVPLIERPIEDEPDGVQGGP